VFPINVSVVFRRYVVRSIRALKRDVSKIAMNRGADIIEEDEAKDISEMLPLESVAALDKFESNLRDDEFFSRAVSIFYKLY